jgi:phosphoglycolate phosphatase-like HAD superfamily hydrolase
MTEKIILWDIDKTLIDPFYEARQQALYCWEHYVQKCYPQAGTLTEEELLLTDQAALYRKDSESNQRGNIPATQQVFLDALERNGIDNPVLDFTEIKHTMQEISLKGTPHFYKGAVACLMKLRERGARCGIVTARTLDKIPENHPLRRFVDANLVFTKESGDKQTTEGRDELVKQIRQKCPDAKFLMIGDQPCDAQMAAALGADYIQPTYGNDQAYLKLVENEFKEAARAIEEAGKKSQKLAHPSGLTGAVEAIGFMPSFRIKGSGYGSSLTT